MKKLLLLIAITFAAVAPQLARQQSTPQAAQQASPAPPPGKIQGIVVRDGTNEPIPGVQITVSATGSAAGLAGAISSQTLLNSLSASGLPINDTIIQMTNGLATTIGARGGAAGNSTATTDGSGHFVIDNVAPGPHSVLAQLDGYFGPSRNGVSSTFVTAPLTVVSQQAAAVTIAMIPGGAISGRVFDSNGQPVVDTQVQVLRFAYQDGAPTLQMANSKASDDRGEYPSVTVSGSARATADVR